MIDEFPAFAVAASNAQGATTVREATELRHKESDRIAVLCKELRKLGVKLSEHADGFTLSGETPPRGGVVEAHGDHRLAMSLAVAGLAAGETVQVNGAEVIAESYPDFVETLNAMGADMRGDT
jgi:3-phosphoshikimate 1-carboxyvinyltransferase